MRDVCKGKPSPVLAKELGISRTTVHILQRAMQCNARQRQLDTPLDDQHTETDEIFRHAGKLRSAPYRPDRHAATVGHPVPGYRTDAHDPPPMVGMVGRKSGQVRLPVVQRTSHDILAAHAAHSTCTQAVVSTDEWQGYAHSTQGITRGI